MEVYTGVVENRMDPLALGRCQVRIHGLHTHDKSILPSSDLPWSYPMQGLHSAAMSGIGDAPVGPVEGTIVVIFFRDEDQQQPIMMGTLGGIPQGEMSVDADMPDLMFGDDSTTVSKPAEIPVVTNIGTPIPPSQEALAVQPVSQAPTTPTNAPIAGIPGNAPFGDRTGSNVKIKGTCANGILAVGRAMDKFGITASYARAAILGIIGGESEWVPQNEGYKYSRSRIQEVFSWLTNEQADKYANWQGTREDFFRFIYGPTTRSGKNLGNKGADDGANYFGRGYVQLTGAYNYARYAKLSGIDIVSNPNLLNDIEQGAYVAVSYFKDRVKVAQNDPGYFDAACQAVGYNVPNIKIKKKAYYQYFLIADANATLIPQKQEQTAVVGEQPPNVAVAPTGFPIDRQASLQLGFRDPNMKYPLREFLNEPDTNRLARGRTDGTSVQTRDNTRMTQIPIADGTTWSQPPIPYNAKYPYNRMKASESGHLFEMDDTPDNERVNLMHRSGTFVEMDVNGTQVNRITGDGYEIIDRNGYVYVKGAYSITSEGFTSIYVNADAHIRVAGHTQIDLEQDLDMNVARDFNLNIGGNWKIDVGGWEHKVIGKDRMVNVGDFDQLIVANDQTINIGGGRTDKIAKDNQTNIDGSTKLVVGADSDWDITGHHIVKIGGDQKFDITGKNEFKIGGGQTFDVTGSNQLKVSGSQTITVGGSQTLVVTGAKTTLAASSMKVVSGADAMLSSSMVMSSGSMSMGSTGGDTVISSSGNTNISSTGNYYLKTTGNYAVDAAKIDLNSGIATTITATVPTPPSAPTINPVGSASSVSKAAPATGLPTATPPSFGNPANNQYQNLTTPPRNFEIDTSFETPEEIATPAGTAFHAKRDTEIVGTKSTPENTPAEEKSAAPVVPVTVTSAPKSCDLIMSMNDFPLSMKLSTSFTLSNLICSPKHVLADQMLQDSRGSNPRKYTKQEIVCNLKGLAENIMEPLIGMVPGGRNGFTITSGYRFAGLTSNESKVSDHPKGNACDIVLTGKNFDYQAHYDLAKQLAAALPFHQLILEYRDPGRPGNSRDKRIVWIHIAHRYVGAAKQVFTMLNDKTYGQGLILLDK